MSPNEYPSPASIDKRPDPAGELAPLPGSSAWNGVRSFVRETLETIALTLIIFVVIRAAVQNFRIEGYSMEPNFHDGQYLLINKIEYLLHPPERGDIVVFRSPQNPDRDFIKRIIGLPGEVVEVREGRVFINGQTLAQPYDVNPGTYNYGPTTVGMEQLFVLGDNRNNSSDSHSWGMLSRADVIGKAWVSYWPPEHWGIVQTPSFASAAPDARPAAAPADATPASPPYPKPTAAYP